MSLCISAFVSQCSSVNLSHLPGFLAAWYFHTSWVECPVLYTRTVAIPSTLTVDTDAYFIRRSVMSLSFIFINQPEDTNIKFDIENTAVLLRANVDRCNRGGARAHSGP